MLIKKSGRKIERLAPNSNVVHLKCFLYSRSLHLYPFICLKKKNKEKKEEKQ